MSTRRPRPARRRWRALAVLVALVLVACVTCGGRVSREEFEEQQVEVDELARSVTLGIVDELGAEQPDGIVGRGGARGCKYQSDEVFYRVNADVRISPPRDANANEDAVRASLESSGVDIKDEPLVGYLMASRDDLAVYVQVSDRDVSLEVSTDCTEVGQSAAGSIQVDSRGRSVEILPRTD